MSKIIVMNPKCRAFEIYEMQFIIKCVPILKFDRPDIFAHSDIVCVKDRPIEMK